MALNFEYNQIATCVTFDGVTTDCGSFTMPDNNAVLVDLTVIAIDTAGNAAGYDLRAVVKRVDGGNVVVVGAAKRVLAEDGPAAGWDASAAAVGDTVAVRVTGAAATTIHWLVDGRFLGVLKPL